MIYDILKNSQKTTYFSMQHICTFSISYIVKAIFEVYMYLICLYFIIITVQFCVYNLSMIPVLHVDVLSLLEMCC
jgi:hypothetical protein